MANTKISALTANNNPNWWEELVYAYNNANGKMTLNTMKTFANTWQQAELVSGVNIKTINGDSILWSWNIVVWWGGGWGGFEPTELWGDANIWELSEWAYITEYDLYYISWETIPALSVGAWRTKKQLLFVTEDAAWTKWYFVFNAWHYGTSSYYYRACYWYSVSSSAGICKRLWEWDESLQQYSYLLGSTTNMLDSISNYSLTQILDWVNSWTTLDLRVSWANPPYPWMTYTVYINSVAAAETYSITLWTWVTNPFNVTLPTNSNKKALITLLVTSSSTAIVTWCTIES